MFREHSFAVRAWGRGVALLMLAGPVLAAAAAPVEAAHRGSLGLSFRPSSGLRSSRLGFSSSSSLHGFRPVSSRFDFSSRSSRFGLTLGDSRFRLHFGVSRHYGYRPYRSYVPYAIYQPYFSSLYYCPPYFRGLYTYGGPFLSYVTPYYSYSVPRSTTVYVYPPPTVRYYGEPAPSRTAPGTRRTPHPYDDPVAPSPEKGSLDEALTRIRTAWLREDLELLKSHLPAMGNISLYHDGDLRRELSADDFMRLTREAVRETRTIRFRFTEVRRPAEDEATATALHTYVGEGLPDADAQTVTLRYDLVRRENVWTLRAVHVGPMEPPADEEVTG